jgi:leader peptidase (prepilin peptidase)/N-methyltransferase
MSGFESLVESVKGAFIGTAIIYWIMILAETILRRPAMGEGDVKLMGAIGAFCGWQGAVFALFGGAVLGTVAMLSLVAARLLLGKGLQSGIPEHVAKAETPETTAAPGHALAGEDDVPEGAVPFGPALSAGALCYLLLAQDYVTAYFDRICWLFLNQH